MAQIALFTNDYRAIGHIDTVERIAYKSVQQMTHQLRKPPAWTYDESIIEQILEYNRDNRDNAVTRLIIQTTDTNLRYSIDFNHFLDKAELVNWRQNKNQQQYRCLLQYWTHNKFNQMKLF
jgi:predicted transcriptional regulator